MFRRRIYVIYRPLVVASYQLFPNAENINPYCPLPKATPD